MYFNNIVNAYVVNARVLRVITRIEKRKNIERAIAQKLKKRKRQSNP